MLSVKNRVVMESGPAAKKPRHFNQDIAFTLHSCNCQDLFRETKPGTREALHELAGAQIAQPSNWQANWMAEFCWIVAENLWLESAPSPSCRPYSGTQIWSCTHPAGLKPSLSRVPRNSSTWSSWIGLSDVARNCSRSHAWYS